MIIMNIKLSNSNEKKTFDYIYSIISNHFICFENYNFILTIKYCKNMTRNAGNFKVKYNADNSIKEIIFLISSMWANKVYPEWLNVKPWNERFVNHNIHNFAHLIEFLNNKNSGHNDSWHKCIIKIKNLIDNNSI